MSGNEATLAAHVDTLKGFGDFGPCRWTRSGESAIGMIHGLFGYGGPVQMLAGSQRAVEIETDDSSPHYAIATSRWGTPPTSAVHQPCPPTY